jgi:hypothetical protein
MKATTDLRDLVHNIVLSDYHPIAESIQIIREKREGKDAAIAVTFENRDGAQRRGLVGLCRHHSKSWQPSGGFMGSSRTTEPGDVWMTWGGWGPGTSQERAVAGGWVADPAAVTARLIDTTGRVLTDEVEHEVFLFMWKGDLDLRNARLDLLDAEGRVLRSGPMRRQH